MFSFEESMICDSAAVYLASKKTAPYACVQILKGEGRIGDHQWHSFVTGDPSCVEV